MSTHAGNETGQRGRGFRRKTLLGLSLSLLLGATSGCSSNAGLSSTWDRFGWFSPPPPPPADTLIIRGDRVDTEAPPLKGTPAADLAGAHELYRRADYGKAERLFRKIADNKKVPPQIAEEARFYEAEAMRRQSRYPRAADTYARLLNDFPSGTYREQSIQHMFEIANYWLDDTRSEMREWRELAEGKRWAVFPEWVHLGETKPFFDEEGRALEKLEQVRYNDITGPLADKSLFLSGSVRFFRKDYKEADHSYSQLVEMHPNSPLAPQAIELAIISKQLSTGGAVYDGRKVAEARRLVDIALRTYPELAAQKSEFLNRQLYSITMQQAEKDWETAEFYRRTGHPCSAYFCYEVVRRRYPGSRYFDMATERMHELRAKLEKAGEQLPPAVPTPGATPREIAPPEALAPGGPLMAPPPRQLPQEILK